MQLTLVIFGSIVAVCKSIRKQLWFFDDFSGIGMGGRVN